MTLDLSALTDGASNWGPPLREALIYLDTAKAPKFVQQVRKNTASQ